MVSERIQRRINRLLGPGDSVGELALLDGQPRSATVIATEATVALFGSRADFRVWLRAHPAAAEAILEAMSLRLRRANERVTDRSFLDVPPRVARLLLGAVSADGEQPELRMTQAELAAAMGATREAVNKALREFKTAGWIEVRRGSTRSATPPAFAARSLCGACPPLTGTPLGRPVSRQRSVNEATRFMPLTRPTAAGAPPEGSRG